jgi:GTPase
MTRRRKLQESDQWPAGKNPNHPKPIVAIVGKPNVGKSTLFNRLVGKKLAIVHDEPGVTRDRHYADTEFAGRAYTLIDTGGFDPDSDDEMKTGINEQIDLAIAEADVVICVLDVFTGLTTADQQAVQLLRKSGKPVLFAANKADSPIREAEASELYRLGVEKLFGISALHGRGIGELEIALIQTLPPIPEDLPDEDGEEDTLIRIAVIGRPNAGKSSLINYISGEERVLVDDRPGTTRDSIDTLVSYDNQPYVFVDTAGIRRKGKVAKMNNLVEAVSVLHAIRAVERCDVVLMMVDAQEGVAEQDAKILGLAAERGRGMIIVLNKADLLSQDELKKAEQNARDKLTFAPYVPVVRISAKTGRGMKGLFGTINSIYENYCKRITTGNLNRFFESVIATHPPPTMGNKAPRLYFITQAESKPPLFVCMSNSPEKIHFSYQRYVANQLRKAFGFDGVPIRIRYRPRRKHWWPDKA